MTGRMLRTALFALCCIAVFGAKGRWQRRLQAASLKLGKRTVQPDQRLATPNVTWSGYLSIDEKKAEVFAIYYEASKEAADDIQTRPILLWLQGGPGCTSLFGMLYINGPYWVNEDDLTLRPNPGSWNRKYGLLYIEQPIGTGFSKRGKAAIPDNELDLADQLYRALNAFYSLHPQFQQRPLIITGESYAGKYVPSITHYILQAHAQANGYISKLKHPRQLRSDVQPPLFPLGGMAIGNGWTDAPSQQMVQGTVAWSLGLIDSAQRRMVDEMSYQTVELLRSKQWHQARILSDTVNEIITNASGLQCLEDVRRNLGYDGYAYTDRYLDQSHVKTFLGVDPALKWESCSAEVDRVMGHDVMRSVKSLVEDVLSFHQVLLYQGQFDEEECGVASNEAWINSMQWKGRMAFNNAPRQVMAVNGRAAFFSKQYEHLWQLVVRNTGHMVPHDNPYYGQILIEMWVEEAVRGQPYDREYTEEEERYYKEARGSDEGDHDGPVRMQKQPAQSDQ